MYLVKLRLGLEVWITRKTYNALYKRGWFHNRRAEVVEMRQK